MNGSAREDMLLDDREQCSGCPVWYQLHSEGVVEVSTIPKTHFSWVVPLPLWY